jgi:hypothetical protein
MAVRARVRAGSYAWQFAGELTVIRHMPKPQAVPPTHAKPKNVENAAFLPIPQMEWRLR